MRESWKGTITLVMLGMFMGWGVAALTLTPNPYLTLPTFMARGSEMNNAVMPVANLPLKLNFLLTEHGEIISELSRTKYDGEDLQKTSDALEANNNQLANLTSKVYGEKARGIFLQMWKEHNLEVLNYTEGVKLDDPIKKEKARKNLENITSQMQQNIKSSNPDYPSNELSSLLNNYIKLTQEIIDTYHQKDISKPELEKKMKLLSNQAEKISDFIVQNLKSD